MWILRKDLVEPSAYKVLHQRILPPNSTRGLVMLKLHYVGGGQALGTTFQNKFILRLLANAYKKLVRK
jgi:hypothetical protein